MPCTSFLLKLRVRQWSTALTRADHGAVLPHHRQPPADRDLSGATKAVGYDC
jgi:hypothetical protein